jgi:hypothetical protein
LLLPALALSRRSTIASTSIETIGVIAASFGRSMSGDAGADLAAHAGPAEVNR